MPSLVVSVGFVLIFLMQACSVVKPYEREKLADRIMESSSSTRKQSLEETPGSMGF